MEIIFSLSASRPQCAAQRRGSNVRIDPQLLEVEQVNLAKVTRPSTEYARLAPGMWMNTSTIPATMRASSTQKLACAIAVRSRRRGRR